MPGLKWFRTTGLWVGFLLNEKIKINKALLVSLNSWSKRKKTHLRSIRAHRKVGIINKVLQFCYWFRTKKKIILSTKRKFSLYTCFAEPLILWKLFVSRTSYCQVSWCLWIQAMGYEASRAHKIVTAFLKHLFVRYTQLIWSALRSTWLYTMLQPGQRSYSLFHSSQPNSVWLWFHKWAV